MKLTNFGNILPVNDDVYKMQTIKKPKISHGFQINLLDKRGGKKRSE